MANDIKCTVKECEYNKEYLCYAPLIQVDRNQGMQMSSSSQETQCQTFKPKK